MKKDQYRGQAGLNGWSVFSFSAGSPTLVHGHMLATGLQFDPYRETIQRSPVMASFSISGHGYTGSIVLKWLIFASFSNADSLGSNRTGQNRDIAAVTGATSPPTITRTITNVTTKETKNRISMMFINTFNIRTDSVQSAIGRI